MANVAFITVIDASKVSICNIPFSATEVLFPVLDTVIVFVTRIFSSSRIGFTCVYNSVTIRIFFTIIKCIVIGIVVSRI